MSEVAAKQGLAPDPFRSHAMQSRTEAKPVVPATPPVSEDLGTKTKDELIVLAEARGVEVASRWTKAKIVAALEEAS